MIEIISGSSYSELKKLITHLDTNSPFLDINFFIALEKSKSIGDNTGWISFPIVAKNNNAHSNLGKQFSDHSIKRTYQALSWGILRPLNGRIESLIGRSRKNRQLMSVTEISGKKAVTNYKTVKVFEIKDIPKISFIECELETGRTHQIRVHMAYKGNSLLGDQQYGKKNLRFKKINEDFEDRLKILNRQALHAKSLGFIHPVSKKLIIFESKLPRDFKKILDLLNKLSH